MHISAKVLVAIMLLVGLPTYGQLIVGDNYNVPANGTGFGLNSGINAGINPPATRLTGMDAANLRYISTSTKPASAYAIAGSKLQVTVATNAGRFTFSSNGTTPFNFASSLGTAVATPSNPVVYDLSINIANSSTGTLRTSFALGRAEGDATTWDFGIQLYRNAATDTFYTIGKRIDTAASGLGSDLNTYITNTAPGTSGSEIPLLMRVTDAGSEASSYNSRVQLSMDGGFSWFYDTDSDPDLPNGWRLNGTGRYIMWDIAPSAGPVTYDNFSLRRIPVSATLISPQNNAQNVGAPNLRVAVSNAVPGDVTVTYYMREAPKPGPGEDFCIAVLPDTQNYAREESGSGQATKEMWFAQTDWIVENRIHENIAYVATLGDCVQNADSLFQWRNATNAMYRLEKESTTLLSDGIPYGITVGNHDQDPGGDEEGSTAFYNQYFGTSHFADKAYYGGHYSTNNDNWYDLFSAGGLDFVVISFEYGRYDDAVLDWAESVIAAHPTRRIIVLTHHAGDDNSDVNATSTSHSVQGAAIYGRLKSKPNFFLMLGGHVFNEGGEGRRADTLNGNTVRTLISDYQGRFNGGNGLMRLMYFSPSNNLVSVKTYSPYTGNFETDANSQFSFSYNMQPNGAGSPGTPYLPVGTNAAVAPGSLSNLAWPGAQANKTYDWYVTVVDQFGNTWISPSSRFTTKLNSVPTANNQLFTITGDQPFQLTLIASDSNGDALTFQTNSHPSRGLNTNFDPINGTIVYRPAHGFRGVDRFTYRASDGTATTPVVNFNVNVVAPTDTNANGLPDSWEATYGVSDGAGDADGDGQNNLEEYIANTNPTNATSVLRISGNNLNGSNAPTLVWSSVGGTRYRIQYADEEVTASFNDILRPIGEEMDPGAYGSSSTQSFTDTFTLSLTNKARYYRIKVVP